MRVRVKICGISNCDDLDAAVKAGADAIGLIVGTTHFSEDTLEVGVARELAAGAPSSVATVMVTHLTDPAAILELAGAVGASTIQAHGLLDDTAGRELWRGRGTYRILRTVHITDDGSLECARATAGRAHGLVLDSRTESRLGGTGLTHDWGISRRIVELVDPQPVILAGGLGPDNVGDAIQTVRPFGVDANSRLKDRDGRKDPESCASFVEAVRSAASATYGGSRECSPE